MVDVICSEAPTAGQRVHADVTLRVGGSAVNAALAADASSTVIGRIGADPAGDLVLRELDAGGITAKLARDAEVPTGITVAFEGPSVVAMRGANAHFAVADVPGRIDADALFVSGFALFQEGSDAAAQAAIERFSGACVGIDVGSPQLAQRARDFQPTGRETIVFATADEARALTGAAPDQAARVLATRFSVACVKLGEEGAIAVAGDQLERAQADEVIRTSPFGAGDAFAAAFLVARVRGEPLRRVLARACEAGAAASAGR